MLVALRDAGAAACGAKAASLGALLRAGLPVPDGVVVPFPAYGSGTGDLVDVLGPAVAALGGGPVAVRSSAADEDGAGASAAGQYRSVLAVHGVEAVVEAVRTCWASLHSPRAVAYREAAAPDREEAAAMAVLVQRLVDADIAGVMFTPGPTDGATRIEASWGLGTGVVGGTVTPDAYLVTADGAVGCAVADKRTRVDRQGAGLAESEVLEADRLRPTLDDDAVGRVADLGRRVADVLGGAQDVEWAMVGTELWVLQARPVTADVPAARSSSVPGSPPEVTLTLTGTPGSRGTATGTARVVRGPGDFDRVRPGDVLVCPWTDPSWTPLLRVAAGVVTETGGVLSHAAIVARERGIPAVLAVPRATTRVPDASTITIDGAAGTLTTHE